MDAVTYPTPEVRNALNRDFVCHTVNEREPGAEGKRFLREHRLLWSPAFVFFEPGGGELRRFVGFRPPDEFQAELEIVLGLTDLLYMRAKEAFTRFEQAVALAPRAVTAPEALYWKGIAARRRDGGMDSLRAAWEGIRRDYPDSTWWHRADVFDARPTGVRPHASQ